MDNIISITIFSFLFIFPNAPCRAADNAAVHYEPVENACRKCSCWNTTHGSGKSQLYVLNCSVRNLNYILAGWPEEFGDNHTGSEMLVSYAGNPIPKLYQLPESDALMSFSCRHCNITSLDSAIFMDTVNIRRVDLSWNQIVGDELRAGIFRGRFSNREYEPIPLEELDLSHNLIHSLDRRLFEHTPHLKKLILSHNQIGLIDLVTASALASVQELLILDLSFNHLIDLPDRFFDTLLQLEQLFLDGNNFKTVPTCLNALGPSLRSLRIGANPIEWITADSFIGYKKLSMLNISAMPELKAVKSGSFGHLKTLKFVDASNNPKMEIFDIESLKEASELKELDVSNSNLSRFNLDYEFEMPIENRTKYWETLHKLRLAGNPWNCDCFMAHTLAGLYFYNNASKYSDFKARCATPYELAGSFLDDLTIESGCQLPSSNMQVVIVNPPLDGHPFLRPKAIILTIVAGLVVVGLALLVGFSIVMIRRRLRKDRSLFTTPIRYTTVRSSAISTMSTANA